VGRGGDPDAVGRDVALDGEGELGEVALADDLAETLLGFEHPNGGLARAHVPDCQRLTLWLVRRTISILEGAGRGSQDGKPLAADTRRRPEARSDAGFGSRGADRAGDRRLPT
jgi:hypothetical protein